MTTPARRSVAGRVLAHPWIVYPVGGALAGILAAYLGAALFGWGRSAATPSVAERHPVHLRVDPTLLRLSSRQHTVLVDVSGLTPNGPVGDEVDGPFADIRGTRVADSKGELRFSEELFIPGSHLRVGTDFRITIIDEATGAFAIAHVQIVA